MQADAAHEQLCEPPDPFNIAWARELIAEALRRMKLECDQSNRQDLWIIFEGRVIRVAMEGREPPEYEQLAAQLQLPAPIVACQLLTTAKRMFVRNLRAVAAEYTDPMTGPDDEIDDLRRILATCGAQSRGRLRT